MIRLYSPQKAEANLASADEWIQTVSARYGLPAAALQSVLYREMIQMDILDPVADWAVCLYSVLYSVQRFLRRMCLTGNPARSMRPFFPARQDSSTGWGQVFARTAIRSIRFALSRGITTAGELGLSRDQDLDAERDEDRLLIWRRLHRDRRFNIAVTALTLLCAADEMTGRTDFSFLSADEIRLVFSRYNANTRTVTSYGESVYNDYLRRL